MQTESYLLLLSAMYHIEDQMACCDSKWTATYRNLEHARSILAGLARSL